MIDGPSDQSEAFAAEWLHLRASADQRARNVDLARALTAGMAGREHVRVLDLGAGTGNNLHATSVLLPLKQSWCLVDADPELLARVTPPDGVSVDTRVADLALGIGPLLDPLPDLVAASALIDLAGATWLDALAETLALHRLPFYCVLSYTGVEEWHPPHPLDASVRDQFHADQSRDKGLGQALGPEAHDYLVKVLNRLGYTVCSGASDWQLTAATDAALMRELAAGTARAVAPVLGEDAIAWGEARAVARSVRVSHSDLLALPPA